MNHKAKLCVILFIWVLISDDISHTKYRLCFRKLSTTKVFKKFSFIEIHEFLDRTVWAIRPSSPTYHTQTQLHQWKESEQIRFRSFFLNFELRHLSSVCVRNCKSEKLINTHVEPVKRSEEVSRTFLLLCSCVLT